MNSIMSFTLSYVLLYRLLLLLRVYSIVITFSGICLVFREVYLEYFEILRFFLSSYNFMEHRFFNLIKID